MSCYLFVPRQQCITFCAELQTSTCKPWRRIDILVWRYEADVRITQKTKTTKRNMYLHAQRQWLAMLMRTKNTRFDSHGNKNELTLAFDWNAPKETRNWIRCRARWSQLIFRLDLCFFRYTQFARFSQYFYNHTVSFDRLRARKDPSFEYFNASKSSVRTGNQITLN